VKGANDSPPALEVPGMISSAAFWMVPLASLAGSEIVIESVGVNPTRTGIHRLSCAGWGADVQESGDERQVRRADRFHSGTSWHLGDGGH
jgi:5-enolpyruvylshikimate-3-phosphate synthase